MAKDSLTGLRQFISGFEDTPFHVGIDVHKRSYYLALHRTDGRTVSAVTPPSPSAILTCCSAMWKTKDPHAQAIYTRLLRKTGIAQKAITAVARRLAIILWRLCIEQRMYRTATA